MKPFLVPNVEMLRTDGPNPVTSAAYAEDFNEVKELGSLTSTTRTADETAAAVFWQDGTIWNGVLRALTTSEDLAKEHYAEHSERPFFGELVDFITGGPLVALVLEGHEAVKAARQLIGATNPVEAAPGSIRSDFGLEVQTNLVHGSDSPESAQREIGLWFPELDG